MSAVNIRIYCKKRNECHIFVTLDGVIGKAVYIDIHLNFKVIHRLMCRVIQIVYNVEFSYALTGHERSEYAQR